MSISEKTTTLIFLDLELVQHFIDGTDIGSSTTAVCFRLFCDRRSVGQSRFVLLSGICGLHVEGRPPWREDGYVCNLLVQFAVTLRSTFRTHDHILLSHLRPQKSQFLSIVAIAPVLLRLRVTIELKSTIRCISTDICPLSLMWEVPVDLLDAKTCRLLSDVILLFNNTVTAVESIKKAWNVRHQHAHLLLQKQEGGDTSKQPAYRHRWRKEIILQLPERDFNATFGDKLVTTEQ
jgi:hypothetical protein